MRKITDNPKVVCKECNWVGLREDRLETEHPFLVWMTVYGCPNCMSIDCFFLACDEEKCWEMITCRTPTTEGYRQTCSDHKPKEVKDD